MTESSHQNAPRSNPFWTYRDPHSGRWVTLMTAAQCQQLAHPVFSPQVRQKPSEFANSPNDPEVSAS